MCGTKSMLFGVTMFGLNVHPPAIKTRRKVINLTERNIHTHITYRVEFVTLSVTNFNPKLSQDWVEE